MPSTRAGPPEHQPSQNAWRFTWFCWRRQSHQPHGSSGPIGPRRVLWHGEEEQTLGGRLSGNATLHPQGEGALAYGVDPERAGRFK